MKTTWTKHLKDKKDKEAFEVVVRNSKIALERLEDIIKSKERKLKASSYESPSWPFFRADQDGYNRALDEILEILNLDHKEKK